MRNPRIELTDLSEGGLKSLYKAISTALEQDDSAPNHELKKFHVRDFPDWRRWAAVLEAELDRRGIQYDRIGW